MPRFPLRLGFVLLFTAAPLASFAGNFFWTGETGNSITTPANWAGASLPGSSDAAVFGEAMRTDVFISANVTFQQLVFVAPNYESLKYYFNGTSTISLGSGLTTAPGENEKMVMFDSGLSFSLNAGQTWSVATNDRVEVWGSVVGSSFTKSGAGSLLLFDADGLTNDLLTVAQGTLQLGSALGTGASIRVESGATLASTGYSGPTIGSAVSLASEAQIGSDGYFTTKLTLGGAVTVDHAAGGSTVFLGSDSLTYFSGTLSGSLAGTTIKFGGGGTAVLRPTSAIGNITSITADGSKVIFDTTQSLPASNGSIYSINVGYIGIGSAFTGSAASVIPKIQQEAFSGTIGFDSEPGGTPNNFTGAVDVSNFNNAGFLGLGSASHATLSGDLTFAADYKFGGGGGRLMLLSSLGGAKALSVISPASDPLTLVLAGSNTFTGNISVAHSFLIFDSSTSLPGSATISLSNSGYVGATSASAVLPANLIGRINAATVHSTAVIGFDSSAPADTARAVPEAIDLSALKSANPSLAELPYLGTTTFGGGGTSLTGIITVPAGMALKLAGLNHGTLNVSSSLGPTTSSSSISSVVVGHPDPEMGEDGTVVLSGANTYAGGTTLLNGTLMLGSDSAKSGSTITSGPIGTGTLLIPQSTGDRRIVQSSGSNRVLHNDIQLPGTELQSVKVLFGDPVITGSLTLDGMIIGFGSLIVEGLTTLNGNNSGFTGDTVVRGTTLTVNHANGLGSGILELQPWFDGTTNHDAEVRFATTNTSYTPYTIGGLEGHSDTSKAVIGSNVNLTINLLDSLNDKGSEFGGVISGAGRLTKTGLGELVLRGSNTYTGGTVINQGALLVANASALGTGSVTIAGGDLGVEHGTHLDLSGRTVTFTSGRLGGQGSFTFDSNLTIGAGTQLHPGIDMPGLLSLTMTNGAVLDLASGGSILWRVSESSLATPGYGWSSIAVNGTVNISATAGSPFDLILGTVNPTQDETEFGTPLFFDYGHNGQWTLLSATSITGFDAQKFSFDTTNFTGANNGLFSISQVGNSLMLNYTAVPEPSTWALIVGVAALGVAGVHRFRRRRA